MAKLKRRKFLKNSSLVASAGVAANPLSYFVLGILENIFNEASAQSGVTNNSNYLLFLHPGAPPRWTYDQFLCPNHASIEAAVADGSFIKNGAVKNVLWDGSSYHENYGNLEACDYHNSPSGESYIKNTLSNGSLTQSEGTIYMPKLWDINLPVWTGSQADYSSTVLMRSLLQNMMIIRGYNINADFGHGSGPRLVSQPVAQLPSISGLLADAGSVGPQKRSFGSLALTDSAGRPLGFRSEFSAMAKASGSSANPVSSILQPFQRNDGNILAHSGNRSALDALISAVHTEIENSGLARNKAYKGIFNDKKAVQTVIDKVASIDPIGNFNTYKRIYDELSKASAQSAPGHLFQLRIDNRGTNWRVPYQSIYYSKSFAMAQVFIEAGLCTNFTFVNGGSAAIGTNVGAANERSSQNDEHRVNNRGMSLSCHNGKYRQFMACANQFKSALGSKFDDTVIHYNGEYARSAKNDGSGTDHAINACITSVISGRIKKFIPIGNIYNSSQTSPSHNNYGTYGVSAPTYIEEIGTSNKLKNEMVAGTILDLLGLKNKIPFRSKVSLIKPDATHGFVSNCEFPRNVKKV